MEIRVLTLFDDDDFLPPEEPKKAPPKTAGKAEKKEEDPVATQEADEIKESITEPAETAQAEHTLSEAMPVDEPAEMVPDIETESLLQEELPVQEEPVGEAAIDPLSDLLQQQPAETADDELNKQLLTELIQTDYAALIHKEYPFDIQQASIVKKDKPAKRPGPRTRETELPEEPGNEVFEEVAPLPEWNLDKNYYTIGEVAQLFSVNTSHIRFWTNEFKLKPRTTRKGDRLYSPADIAELRLIHHLVKEKKHTIKGAREKLKAEKSGVHTRLDLKESLTRLKDMLTQIREQL